MRESPQFVHEMTAAQDGILQVQKDPNPMANPMMSNPSLIFEGMRKNLPHMILQPMVMAWVSYFFAGFVLVPLIPSQDIVIISLNSVSPREYIIISFVLSPFIHSSLSLQVKIPFGLTPRFKSMLQRGVELDSLDVSYVSSLSWYLLTLFGLMGVNSLILGSDGTGGMIMFFSPSLLCVLFTRHRRDDDGGPDHGADAANGNRAGHRPHIGHDLRTRKPRVDCARMDRNTRH